MSAIAPADVKAKVVGIGPWLTAAAALSTPWTYNDTNISQDIVAATRKFEQDSQFTINPVQIWTHNTGDNPNPGALYVMEEDPYDYMSGDGFEYFRIKLRHHPVQSVQRVRVMFGTTVVYLLPTQWYSVKRRVGMFHIVPQFGSLAVGSAAAAWATFTMAFNGIAWKDYLPDAIGIDYVAGLFDANNGGGDPANGNASWYDTNEWAALRRCIEKASAAEMLKNVKELADAGLISVSASGAGSGQTLQYTRFKDTIELLESDVASFHATLEDTEQLMPMYSI